MDLMQSVYYEIAIIVNNTYLKLNFNFLTIIPVVYYCHIWQQLMCMKKKRVTKMYS